MSELVTSRPVCVTGASGFVASWIVKDLLQAGYTVRGTVRDASKLDKYDFLTSLPGAEERLELVTANLLEPETFAEAVQGCEMVMHTASPYTLTVKDAQKDLVDPAVLGTKGVLEACIAADVKRVVLTSSAAAITDEPEKDRVMNEEDWNEKSSLTRNPYYYSKTMAEKAAWELAKGDPGLDLVVINPVVVVGPSLTPSLNTSNKILSDLLGGQYPGIVNLGWAIVDVRDVAQAHILAMQNPEASGRYLCSHLTLTMREVIAKYKELGFAAYKLPKLGLDSSLGDTVVGLVSYFQPAGTRSFLKTNLGRPPQYDNSKIREGLGLQFQDINKTLKETAYDLVEWGHLKAY